VSATRMMKTRNRPRLLVKWLSALDTDQVFLATTFETTCVKSLHWSQAFSRPS
jgi:hypothetical protein